MFFPIKCEMGRVILLLHVYQPECVFWTGRLPMLPVLFYFFHFPLCQHHIPDAALSPLPPGEGRVRAGRVQRAK